MVSLSGTGSVDGIDCNLPDYEGMAWPETPEGTIQREHRPFRNKGVVYAGI